MTTGVAAPPVRVRSDVTWRLPRAGRKAVRVVHLIGAVSWIGADLGLITLAIAANVSDSARVGQSAVVGLGFLATWVAGPLSVLSLVSGIALSLTTRWGLFRHAWVIVSHALNVVMVVLVFLLLGPGLRAAADQVMAAAPGATPAQVLGRGAIQLMVAPSVAFVTLVFVAVVNVYKPWMRKK